MDDKNLKNEIRKCRRFARKGAKLSREQLKKLSITLNEAKTNIDKTLINLNNSTCYLPEVSEALSDQLKQTKDSFDMVSSQLLNDVVDLENNLSDFRITLFGRTMAGKSTLMEILTEGTGESIGKGAQRTTRDTREYSWKNNNLKITDVPGIAAFDGQDDENVAYESAKQADLILFLITDDGPQAYEADCLSYLREMGKPIICVVNVKSSIQKDKLKLSIRDAEKKFDKERLDEIKDQFVLYGKNVGKNWDDIQFIYVHLLSAFMSQNEADTEIADKLHEISHIDDLTAQIIEQVETRGKYYRVKNFNDIVSVPVLETIENLFRQSLVNRDLNTVIFEKKRNLEIWKSDFARDANNRIDTLVEKIRSQLQSEVALFAEDHFADKNAEKAWNELVAQKNLEGQCDDVLNDLSQQCIEKVQELSREISAEFSYYEKTINNTQLSIQHMSTFVNQKRAWNWGMIATEGGLAIAAVVAGCVASGPVGWILGGVSLGVTIIHTIGSFLFAKFGNNADKARKKLEESLNENVEKISDSLTEQMRNSLDMLIRENIDKQLGELEKIIYTVSQLSFTQKSLGKELIPRYREQNCSIISEALKLLWNFLTPSKINTAARIPGSSIIIFLENKKSIPDKIISKLELLMQESVTCLDFKDQPKMLADELFYTVPEIKRFIENTNSGNYFVGISEPTKNVIEKIRLAEQLCGTIIEYKVV